MQFCLHAALLMIKHHFEMMKGKVVTRSECLQKPLRATVEPISFSAHADYTQTSGFVQDLAPADIILVHGEHKEMERLKNGLTNLGKETTRPWTVHTPKITKSVILYRKPVYPAKVSPSYISPTFLSLLSPIINLQTCALSLCGPPRSL